MLFGLLPVAGLAAGTTHSAPTMVKPNVIFILADDLGYGDLGCYGQKRIQTPNLDRMAAEGMRFTQCYAGSTVCSPSRCAFITGKNTGHCTIRGNHRPELPIGAGELTVAEVFKAAGYATALIGKWGLGLDGSPGAPERKGFDYFFGYPSQTSAHNYYPPYLMRGSEKVVLAGNENGKRTVYSHDLFMQEAVDYVRKNRDHPFFLFLSLTIPHANNEERPNGIQVPSDAPYSKEDWPQVEKNFAASITLMDASVGRLLKLLKELGIDDNTMVWFTSDNGPHSEGGHSARFFDSGGPLRGIKRDLYEGGIRMPLIVRWPGRIKAGVVTDQILAFWDLLPTFAALVGQPVPKGIDGISVLPALLEDKRVPHPPLYWEFHEDGFSRAVRMGNWKGVSLDPAKPLDLYDLTTDLSEKHNVAAGHPDIVKRIEQFMEKEHVPNPIWPDNERRSFPK